MKIGCQDTGKAPATRITPEGLLRAVSYIRQRFASVGIKIPRGSRLESAERLVQSVLDDPLQVAPGNPELLLRLANAHWTILEFCLIAKAGHISKSWRSQLQSSLGGAEIEEDDRNSQSRNLLFEVYLAAVLSACGLPVRQCEPDLQVWPMCSWLSVAVKRVASPRQIRRRARGAIRQIERSGVAGFVAINLDQVLIHTGVAGFAERVARRRARSVGELERVDDLLWSADCVIGRVIFGRDFVWDFSGDKPGLALENYLQVQPTTHDPEAALALDLLWLSWKHRALPRLLAL